MVADRGPSLQQAAPYIARFRGQTVVVKLGGELQVGPVLARIVPQLAVLAHCGLRPVVVHGGGKQIDQRCAERGIEIQKVGGRRITSPAVMEVVASVVGETLNQQIIELLAAEGIQGRGHADGVTRGVRCRRRPPRDVEEQSVDFGLVGDIEQIDIAALRGDDGAMPVLPSLGVTDDGTLVNVNADSVASRVAVALGAQKLVMLCGVAGVMTSAHAAGPISQLTVSGVRSLLDGDQVGGGMRPKLEEALEAIAGGVPQVQIISGVQSHTLLREIFTVEGCGTLIVEDEHE